MSSFIHWSTGEACSLIALSAGCGFSNVMAVVRPSYDTPYIPTLPLLLETFFTSQSMVSYASVVSFVDFGSARLTCDDNLNTPSDLNRPRRFWMTKMYPSWASSFQLVGTCGTGPLGTPYGVRRNR